MFITSVFFHIKTVFSKIWLGFLIFFPDYLWDFLVHGLHVAFSSIDVLNSGVTVMAEHNLRTKSVWESVLNSPSECRWLCSLPYADSINTIRIF